MVSASNEQVIPQPSSFPVTAGECFSNRPDYYLATGDFPGASGARVKDLLTSRSPEGLVSHRNAFSVLSFPSLQLILLFQAYFHRHVLGQMVLKTPPRQACFGAFQSSCIRKGARAFIMTHLKLAASCIFCNSCFLSVSTTHRAGTTRIGGQTAQN